MPESAVKSPGRVRRVLAVVANVGASLAGAMAIASLLPGPPTLSWWKPVVLPAFVMAFAPFVVFVLDSIRQSLRSGSRRQRMIIRGWRGIAAIALIAVSFFLAFSNDGPANPVQRDGKYYDDQHGQLIEITEQQWHDGLVGQSRLFATLAMLFNGLAALGLTEPTGKAHR